MRNELIKITTTEDGKKLVSARELHEFLGLSKRFSAWFETYSKNEYYGFIENEDFTSVLSSTVVNNGAERQLQDYAITIDMAKELSMLSKTPKGGEARKYFIQCEKQLKEISNKAFLLEAIYNGGQEGILASKKLTELEVKEATTPLLNTIQEQKPMVEFANTVSESSDSIDFSAFVKVIRDENVFTKGRNKLFEWMRDNGYLRKNNEPYQQYMDMGLFDVKEYTYKTPYGEKLSNKTLLTGKGQIYFVEKLRKEFCE